MCAGGGGGGDLIIRLYFADTPESDYRFMDRTRAQAGLLRDH